jgi:hypothetical protein
MPRPAADVDRSAILTTASQSAGRRMVTTLEPVSRFL